MRYDSAQMIQMPPVHATNLVAITDITAYGVTRIHIRVFTFCPLRRAMLRNVERRGYDVAAT